MTHGRRGFSAARFAWAGLAWAITGMTASAMFAVNASAMAKRASETAPGVLHADTPLILKCKNDLAKRLKLSARDISTVAVTRIMWPDTSLGMPENGKLYSQVRTPGFKILLETGKSEYLYTTGPSAIRYGGPVPLWSASSLYLVPTANDPNLNGELYQCSLTGTNNMRLASSVAEYYPQANGAVLFTRRTSRSGHDLFLVKANNPGKTTALHSSFAFGDAALSARQDQWAAFTRPRVGMGWQIEVGDVGDENNKRRTFSLPDGLRPERIAWVGDNLLILGKQREATVCFQTSSLAESPLWSAAPVREFPGIPFYSLNKSEMLEISPIEAGGKPGVEVAGVWFNGDKNVLATISDLTLRGHSLLVLRGYDFNPVRFPFIWGERGDKQAAFTVDIATGEVIPGILTAGRNIKPFAFHPANPPHRITMRN